MQRTKMMTILSVLAVFAVVVMPLDSVRAASKEKVLYDFSGGSDGLNPLAGVVFDTVGNLYGTTPNGGINGRGNVFELAPGANGKWTEKVLYSFNSDGIDGNYPSGGLVFDTAGNLYGTTAAGGTASACGSNGCGTVFELTPAANGKWTEKVLHSFDCNTEGCGPVAGLIFDKAGNLYGTTFYNGAHFAGTVFELTPGSNGQWTEKVLSNFDQAGDQPAAGLIFDKAGNLYGTTSGGGAHFAGTVFELAPGSNGQWTEKVLYNFANSSSDGASPYAGLIFDAAGNLYGTTEGGGIGSGCPPFGLCGTIFELTPGSNGQWTEQVLHTFDSSGKDGWSPQAGLIFDKAGNLYGTTRQGGVTVKGGTVFRLTP
jgi:uncharacterized repeat protein (TIGR03803 family)